MRVLPTKWRRKPAGIDMERNYVTATLCISGTLSKTLDSDWHVDRRNMFSVYFDKYVRTVWETSNRRRSNKVENTCHGRHSTDDLGQFPILSVYLCVRHDTHKAARRASLSTTHSWYLYRFFPTSQVVSSTVYARLRQTFADVGNALYSTETRRSSL